MKETIRTINLSLKHRKGQNLSIKTMAMIVLGIMVVVLVYGAFSGWFDSVSNRFASEIVYPNPRSQN
jgi:hypothetical protein